VSADSDGIPILVADDSAEDCHLLKRAFVEAQIPNRLDFVHSGRELLDRLRAGLGQESLLSFPGIILLDLKMPGMDGREALQAIRQDPEFRLIPVLMLTTSSFKEEILDCYRLGANSVLAKPLGFGDFVGLATILKRYWLENVQLPLKFSRS
jgi:CheY-like chemotaxis protein